jgi:hypothetical protein
MEAAASSKACGIFQGFPNCSKVFQAVASLFSEKKDCLFLEEMEARQRSPGWKPF